MKRKLSYLMLVFLAGSIAGCTFDNFTEYRFNTLVRNGQTKAEVEEHLGEPMFRMKNIWQWRIEKTMATGSVYFDQQGMVKGKKWVGPKELGDYQEPPLPPMPKPQPKPAPKPQPTPETKPETTPSKYRIPTEGEKPTEPKTEKTPHTPQKKRSMFKYD